MVSDGSKLAVGLTLLLLGCAANNFFLELIISPKRNSHADPGAGPLLTFMQFLTVSALGFVALLQWPKGGLLPRLAPMQVPLTCYLKLVGLFFLMSTLNNYAFALHISQPLHMVFRSSSLVAAFGMGYLFFGKNYTLGQFVAVVTVSAGAFCATAAEALVGDTATAAAAKGSCAGCEDDRSAMKIPDLGGGADAAAEAVDEDYIFTWCLGIATLSAVLLLAALLSQYQDTLYRKYGRNSLEMLFYSHAMSLPMFVLAAGDLRTHAALWSASPPASEAIAELFSLSPTVCARALGPLETVPVMWVYVLGNVICQYICVRGVFMVGQASGALTLTLSLTFRKFFSLFLSIWFFGNTFTLYHWGGAALVFAGIGLYNLAKPKAKPAATAAGGAAAGTGAASGGAAAGGKKAHSD